MEDNETTSSPIGSLLTPSAFPYDTAASISLLVTGTAAPFYFAFCLVTAKSHIKTIFRNYNPSSSWSYWRTILAVLLTGVISFLFYWIIHLDSQLRLREVLIGTNLDEKTKTNPEAEFLKIVACGLAVEGCFLILWCSRAEQKEKQQEQDQEKEDHSQRQQDKVETETTGRWSPLRFSILCLFLSTSFFFNGLRIQSNYGSNKYEYKGPLRLTKRPTLHLFNRWYSADDTFVYFPCLQGQQGQELLVNANSYTAYYNQSSVRVNLEVGFGSEWACQKERHSDFLPQHRQPNNQTTSSKWFTLWPLYDPCAQLICQPNTPTACPCAETEETARAQAWQCLDQHFANLDVLTNETNTTLLKFDQTKAPWEDDNDNNNNNKHITPWPTINYYANCKGRMGQIMEPAHVDASLAMAARMNRLGALGFATWMCLVLAMVAQCSILKKTPMELREHEERRRGEEWQRLVQLRRRQDADYIDDDEEEECASDDSDV